MAVLLITCVNNGMPSPRRLSEPDIQSNKDTVLAVPDEGRGCFPALNGNGARFGFAALTAVAGAAPPE